MSINQYLPVSIFVTVPALHEGKKPGREDEPRSSRRRERGKLRHKRRKTFVKKNRVLLTLFVV